MAQPPVVTFSTGSNPQTAELNDNNDNEDSILDQMNGIIQQLYETAKDKLSEILQCPGGQRRGWKILDGDSVVEFAPCGCYDDALWPYLLGVPAAAKAGGAMAAKLLIKKARKKWTRKAIKESTHLLTFLVGDYYRAIKGLRNGTAYLTRKTPPVKPGFIRLYRGQGARKLQQKVNPDLDLDSPFIDDDYDNPVFDTPSGKYWTADPGYADRFTRTDSGLHTNNSQMFYIDVPIEEANRTKLGTGRNGTVNDIKMLPGQKYGAEVGGIEWRDGEYHWPSHIKMPLRRRNSEGVIEIVNDTPDATRDIDLNPDVFAQNEQSAGFEYYLDSSMYNTTYVSDLSRETNLAKESTALAFQDLKDKTKKILDKQKELEALLDNPNTPNSELIKLVSEIEDTGSNLNQSIDSLFDKYEADGNLEIVKKVGEKTADWIAYFKYFIPWFLGLLAFIETIMSLVTIVKDKSCIPLIEGGLSEFSNKPRMAQIRAQRIQAKASVWAELNPETCECSECPSGWNFCDHSSITNLWLKETNSCIPPCCGDQEFKPITLIELCKCDCPPGKVWMPCECSDCTQSDSFLTRIFNPSEPGQCVDPNPDPEKLEWNSKSCSWECKNYTVEYPLYSFGAPVKKPLPLCKDNKLREPNSCECSGNYSIDPCISTEFQQLYNVVTATSIKVIK